jgi:GNAT superfamily N-acetyltransferase
MTEMQVRPIRPEDAEAFGDFIGRIPEGDRTFFKEDLLDQRVVAFLLQGESGVRLVAVSPDGGIDRYGAVLPGVGWSSHVGDLRLVVDPERRRQGVGRGLARQLLVEALGRESASSPWRWWRINSRPSSCSRSWVSRPRLC